MQNAAVCFERKIKELRIQMSSYTKYIFTFASVERDFGEKVGARVASSANDSRSALALTYRG